MLLAQALKERADLRKRIKQIAHELSQLCSHPRYEYQMSMGIGATNPDKDVIETAKQNMAEREKDAEVQRLALVGKINRLISLNVTINTANETGRIEYNGTNVPLAQALVMRDASLRLLGHYDSCLTNSRNHPAIDRKLYQRYRDNAARAARILDDLIQQANWQIEVSPL